ncbi:MULTISPECIES: peptidylprolyl isomerase [unclassified Polynucleobacter]|uniref:peptidylprolyl isomerase n=1 Tax=unclassified Polynucleobacter TaxID=2640945 RepID=UPI001BFDA7D9|nr:MULTISPECIES: peptidylprolyl isomerase [unclassified Polynucleobacter]MBU3632044.1 peptidylprolyl isomerase [Polynucleobacter sp. AP-Feld-500C-C5]QWD71382.1 peptidylprolyl isomerase [Polynucleobacter sp. UB-Siik-W21]
MLNTLHLISFSLAALLISAPAFAQNAAIVNGKSIPKAQLDKLVQKSGQGDNPQVRDQAREMLVTKELILQEADKRGVIQKESVREQLEQSRVGILVAAVFEDYIEKEGVTEAELKAAYESVKTQYTGKEYHVEHILVEKETDAKAIIAQIKAGGNFGEIAKAKSKDPGSATNGGDLGWVNDKALVPEFSKAMVQLKNGQMTDKPVKSQFGWHIIKTVDSRDMKAPSFDELKAELKQMIASDQNWQKAKFTEMMQKLRAKAKVQ